MRALVLATLLLLAAAPAHAAPSQAAPRDYWQYVATYATERQCEEAAEDVPWGVDYHACQQEDGAWDLYWVFLT
ncbi:hypothetical protein [Saccharothrix sp. HUAS TT1]|uniref:hypothetical protein n=1 Tax=unclassified Saccharothrix TaxID=2593673 RepID=UPI00345BE95F